MLNVYLSVLSPRA